MLTRPIEQPSETEAQADTEAIDRFLNKVTYEIFKAFILISIGYIWAFMAYKPVG